MNYEPRIQIMVYHQFDNSELHLISSDNIDIAFQMVNGESNRINISEAEILITDMDFYLNISEKEGFLFDSYNGKEHMII